MTHPDPAGPSLDAYLQRETPPLFLFGALEDDGYILTLSGDGLSTDGYDERIAVLARFISKIEESTEKSAETIIRDLIAERNDLTDSDGGHS